MEHFIARTRAEQEDGNRRLAAALEDVERSALRGRIAALATLATRPAHDRHDGHHASAVAAAAATPPSEEPPAPPAPQPGALLADRVYGLDWEQA